MADAGFEMVRYADDVVILCRTADEAAAALATVQRWTAAAGLRLHPEKTHLVDMQAPGGVDFLGITSSGTIACLARRASGSSGDAVRRTTRRTNGQSLAVLIADLNRTSVGWFGYFKHSHGSFEGLDAWIRTQLRGLLPKRAGFQRRRRAADHRRWPVAFFAAQGLFSLAQAHAAARQSRPG
jgi:RNA-directed DNA polymerase